MYAQSQLIHTARKFGAGGIWLPPGPSMCRDVSGYGRHAYINDADKGTPHSIPIPDMQGSAWDGDGGSWDPYIADLPADIPEPNSLMAYVYMPDASQSGAFIMLTNNGARGLGVGVGSTDFETAGGNLLVLNESRAWHSAGTLGTGWKFVVMSSTDGSNNHKMWLDGVNVATQTRSTMDGVSTADEVHVCGYSRSATDRCSTGGIALTGWWDRALTDAECVALSIAARHRRAMVD